MQTTLEKLSLLLTTFLTMDPSTATLIEEVCGLPGLSQLINFSADSYRIDVETSVWVNSNSP